MDYGEFRHAFSAENRNLVRYFHRCACYTGFEWWYLFNPSDGKMIAVAVVVCLAKILAGFVLVHLLWSARDFKALLFKFFLGFGAGMGISALLYFLWFWLKLPVALYPYFELTLFVLLLITVFVREKR